MRPLALLEKPLFFISEWATGYRHEKRVFQQKLGYPLDLANPRSFNEKMCWRKINDRNPLFPVIADKFQVRKYITNRLGNAAHELLVPLLYETVCPETIPFNHLPIDYIVKANHGSGMHLMIREGSKIAKEQVIRACKDWLQTPYGYFKHEWAYQRVQRRILVEELLQDEEGQPVREYKFHMFAGSCELVQAHNSFVWDEDVAQRGEYVPSITYYSKTWEWIDMWWGVCSPGSLESKPRAFDQMLEIAKELSEPFDYLRVDFYLAPDGIKLGELTPYHLSGRGQIRPTILDFELGSKWPLNMQGFQTTNESGYR